MRNKIYTGVGSRDAPGKWNSASVRDNPDVWIKYLKECFKYNSENGILTWQKRPAAHFLRVKDKRRHDSTLAGREAGHVIKRRKTFYRRVKILGATVEAHIIIWLINYNTLPSGDIDHIDGNGLNNQLSNLRDYDNHKNKIIPDNNKTGIVGVYWNSKKNRWCITGGRKQIGTANSLLDAACLRKSWELRNGYTVRNTHGC